MLLGKLVRRKVPTKNCQRGAIQKAGGDRVRQEITLVSGLDIEICRKIVKLIKDAKFKKVQAAIEGDKVRVSSPSRDELQEVIAALKGRTSAWSSSSVITAATSPEPRCGGARAAAPFPRTTAGEAWAQYADDHIAPRTARAGVGRGGHGAAQGANEDLNALVESSPDPLAPMSEDGECGPRQQGPPPPSWSGAPRRWLGRAWPPRSTPRIGTISSGPWPDQGNGKGCPASPSG